MKNLKKALSFSLVGVSLVALTATDARALDHIIRPYQSVRSAGMGGVRYTTGLYDENFFGNPARAAENPTWRIDIINLMLEVNSGALENFDKLTGDGDEIENAASTVGTNNHMRFQNVMPAVYFPSIFSSKHSMAFGLIQSLQADVDVRRNLSVDPTVISDIGPAVTYARRLLKDDRLTVGATAHVTYRVATKSQFSTIDYIREGTFKFKDKAGEGMHYDFDLGATLDMPWNPNKWKFQSSLAINNILDGKYSNMKMDLISGVPETVVQQPRTFNAGISGVRERLLGIGKGTVAFEVQDIGNNKNGSLFRLLHIGGELNFWDYIMVRAGINQGYFTGGVGFDLPALKIDLSTYGEEMSLNAGGLEDRRYALRFGLAI